MWQYFLKFRAIKKDMFGILDLISFNIYFILFYITNENYAEGEPNSETSI